MKNFDEWNKKKKYVDSKKKSSPVRIGDVFLTHLGINIGTKTNGNEETFLRPVVVIKVFNQNHVLIVPASKTIKENSPFHHNSNINNINGSLILTQIRAIFPNRFLKRIERLKKAEIDTIIRKFKDLL